LRNFAELELLLSNRNSELLQERERANQLQRQLDREQQLHLAAGATAILAGGGAGGAIVPGDDGGELDRGGLAQQLRTFRARALQAEASVREVRAQLEQIQQAGGGENADEGGLTHKVKEFRARALSAEASTRELQTLVAQSVADKALMENKLVSLGNSLVTLKTSLTERDTGMYPPPHMTCMYPLPLLTCQLDRAGHLSTRSTALTPNRGECHAASAAAPSGAGAMFTAATAAAGAVAEHASAS